MAHTDNRSQPSTGPSGPVDAGAWALEPLSKPPMALWVLSVVLMLVGALVHSLPLNRQWMLSVHTQAVMPPEFWGALTLLGFGWAAVILVCLCDRRSGVGALAVLISLVVGGVLVQVLKHWAQVSRPGNSGIYDSLQFIGTPVTHGGSMPSGHAVAAFSAAALVWLVLAHERKISAPVQWGLGVLAVLSAWSRVAVGAHWPADVLAGAGFGLALAGVCWWAAMGLQGWWQRRRSQVSPSPSVGLLRSNRSGGTALTAMHWVGVLEVCAGLVCLTEDVGHPEVIVVQWGLGLAALLSAYLRLTTPKAQGMGA